MNSIIIMTTINDKGRTNIILKKSIIFVMLFLFWIVTAFAQQDYYDRDIGYSTKVSHNDITELQKKIDNGETNLLHDNKTGYLKSLLKHLNISPSSQMLVFSKTSFQNEYITPHTPRAIYFSDNVYIGWVQHGTVMEISTQDPQLGGVYYTLSQVKKDKPKFKRETHDCFQCHVSRNTLSVPGPLVRSVFPDKRGFPILHGGTFLTTHESKITERWGGWYVTGNLGLQTHMGNAIAVEKGHRVFMQTDRPTNLEQIDTLIDTTPYAENSSDVIALLVLEHQTHMHNLITKGTFDTIIAINRNKIIQQMSDTPFKTQNKSLLDNIHATGDKIIEYLLFCNEIAIASPITGRRDFQKAFEKRGPIATNGATLREFNLKTRLFKYPCSYLIYSKSFDEMPPLLLEYVYKELWDIFSDKRQDDKFLHISRHIGKQIKSILIETKDNLPPYWR